ncbi:MAG: YlmC/YmxH family sporulation protein [Clostridiales bacterium]|jgi:YlmC/YmxH family sporulation protein|nr:YlmC/YmxH family sporulation protein [Clostridiales bacterium]
MSEFYELSYCELRAKEVVNVSDGRRLGRIVDVVFGGPKGEISGVIVPEIRRVFFSRGHEIFIPWRCVTKIGEDVILVSLSDIIVGGRKKGKHGYGYGRYDPRDGHGERRDDDCREECRDGHDDGCREECNDGHSDGHAHKDGRCVKDKDGEPRGLKCDRKCEKCMLFDCAYRWKIH